MTFTKSWIHSTTIQGALYGATRVPTVFYNSATGVATGPAQLSFPVGAMGMAFGQNYAFEASVNIQNPGAGGVKIGIVGPSGTVSKVGIQGISTGTITQNDYLVGQTALSTGIYGLPVNSQVSPVWISGIITCPTGVTGPLQIGFVPTTNGNTGAILDGSFLSVMPST